VSWGLAAIWVASFLAMFAMLLLEERVHSWRVRRRRHRAR